VFNTQVITFKTIRLGSSMGVKFNFQKNVGSCQKVFYKGDGIKRRVVVGFTQVCVGKHTQTMRILRQYMERLTSGSHK
jgi:hypothetical protein